MNELALQMARIFLQNVCECGHTRNGHGGGWCGFCDCKAFVIAPLDVFEVIKLECPTCGNVGAVADRYGCFTDGQPSICGCEGWVSVDSESEPFINSGD